MLGHLFENVFKDVMTDDEFANWLIFKNIFEEVSEHHIENIFKEFEPNRVVVRYFGKSEYNKPNKYILISHKHKLIP